MNIRTATDDDVTAITLKGLQFVSNLKTAVAATHESVERSVAALIHNPESVVLVSTTDDGDVVGFLIGVLTPMWFSDEDWSAVELAWWVDPSHRGFTGARLVHAFEEWAASHHVSRVVMSDIELRNGATPAGPLVERLGYHLHERAFIKDL